MAKTVNTSEVSKAKTSKKASNEAKKGPNKVAKYFRDLKNEFNKVIWPSRKQVVNNTLVVLSTMIILGLFVGGIDLGLSTLFNLLVDLA